MQGLVLSCRVPRNATDTRTTVCEWCAIKAYIEPNQALPAVFQEKMKGSRKVISPKDNKWACRLFPHTTCWTSKREPM